MRQVRALAALVLVVGASTCGVDYKKGNIPAVVHQDYDVDLQSRNSREAQVLQSARQPIRIATVKFPTQCSPLGCFCTRAGENINSFHNDATIVCTAQDILTTQKRQYLENVIDSAVTWLQRAFKLDRSTTPIRVLTPNNICGLNSRGASVTVDQRNVGFTNADFAIYVTAVPATGLTQAWAVDCQHDQSGRPTVALINFSPSAFDSTSTSPTTYENSVSTAIHELMHALGFGSEFYEKPGWFPTNSGRATSTKTGVDGKPVTIITTPKVLEKAKAHFGCTRLTGVELENQGGSGTAGSHWEKRILGAESMTGIQTSEKSVISELTLAYFEDTGVYDVDYVMAQHLEWGKNRGCEFTDQKCNSAANKNRAEYCFPGNTNTAQLLDACTISRLGYGRCNIQEHTTNLPTEFQYFTNQPRVGGGAFLTDYCPYYVPSTQCTDPHTASGNCDSFNEAVCRINSATCSYDSNAGKCLAIRTTILGQVFGDGSRCFTADMKRNGWNINTNGHARCFSVRCADNLSSYNIITHNGYMLYCDNTLVTALAPTNITSEYTAVDVLCAPVESICGPRQWKMTSVAASQIIRPTTATPQPPTGQPASGGTGPGFTGVVKDSSDDDSVKIAIIIVAACCGVACLVGIYLIWKHNKRAQERKSSFASSDVFISKNPYAPTFNSPINEKPPIYEPKKPKASPTNYMVQPPNGFYVSPKSIPKPPTRTGQPPRPMR